jgi:hypothetical protein
LVRFWLNLGLNNLKFGQESISAVDLIQSNQSNRIDPIESIQSNRSNRIDPIELIQSEMDSWTNFKLFRPKLSQNRTKTDKIKNSDHTVSFFTTVNYRNSKIRIDPIESIQSNRSNRICIFGMYVLAHKLADVRKFSEKQVHSENYTVNFGNNVNSGIFSVRNICIGTFSGFIFGKHFRENFR